MGYGAWRGMVGTVKPTKGSGSLEELIRMLPDGIGVIPLFNNIKHGTIGEFRDVVPSYEEKVAELAADKVDLIHPAGTPPFMLLGYRSEQELIAAWEKKYGVPIFTSGSNQVRALKALGVKKFVGIGYDFEDTSIVERYFTVQSVLAARPCLIFNPEGPPSAWRFPSPDRVSRARCASRAPGRRRQVRHAIS
jgi:maleate isomerase